jgi:hypothetical protein
MKISNEVFEQMKMDIEKLFQYYNLMNLDYKKLNSKDFFNTWHRLYQNIYSPTECMINSKLEINPNIDFLPNGQRLFDYNPNFDFYPCNSNDSTLLTALKKAVKQVLEK